MTALIFCDGFDKYGPAGSVLSQSFFEEYATTGSAAVISAPLSATGYSVAIGSFSNFSMQLPASYTRVAGSLRFNCNDSTAGASIGFRLGGTYAFTILMSPTPTQAVRLYTGNIATFIAGGGLVAQNSIHTITWDITIGAAASYTVYMDGILLFTGSNGNTGSGNTTVNNVAFNSPSGGNLIVDDLILFNPLDAAYNPAMLSSDLIVETSFPISDDQKQFTNDGNIVTPTGLATRGFYASGVNVTTGMGTNTLFLIKVIPVVNSTINSVSILIGSIGGAVNTQHRGVIYSDSGGNPNALLSNGAEVIGSLANAVLTSVLSTPQALSAGTSYWIGFLIGISATYYRAYDGSTTLGRRATVTYSATPPSTAPAMTVGIDSMLVWGNCTGATVNWGSVSLNPRIGTVASQIHSNTPGQEDLYNFPPLTTSVSAIYGVAVKGLVSKSNAGARTVSFNMKSGISDSTGSAPGQFVTLQNQWQESIFDLDPATGLPWTMSGLNNAKSGISVAS